MNEAAWLQTMARIRGAWCEPFLPSLYAALRAHHRDDVDAAVDWLSQHAKALPPPGNFLEAVLVAKRNREAMGTRMHDLPTGQPASREEKIEAFRRAILATIEDQCRGLDGEERAAKAQAVRRRFASISPMMAEAEAEAAIG